MCEEGQTDVIPAVSFPIISSHMLVLAFWAPLPTSAKPKHTGSSYDCDMGPADCWLPDSPHFQYLYFHSQHGCVKWILFGHCKEVSGPKLGKPIC